MTKDEKKRLSAVIRTTEYLFLENIALKLVLEHRAVPNWQKLLERLLSDKEILAGVRLKFRDLYEELERSADPSNALDTLLEDLPASSTEEGAVGESPLPRYRSVLPLFALDCPPRVLMNRVEHQVEQNGFGVVPACVSEDIIRELAQTVDGREHGVRNLLTNPVIRNFAASEIVRTTVASVLGKVCFAVRGIFFNKNPSANWRVVWHQDSVIAVRERVEVEGWGPWSLKAGVTHVRPAAQILNRMLAIRIHLDDCGHDNAPLRVIPGSHRQGFLSDSQIQDLPKEEAVSCVVHRGDAHSDAPSPATRFISCPASVQSPYHPLGVRCR
jgi:phytanoyl-CoA dioxygenase PhyH